MAKLTSLLNFLIHSNIFIALAAVFLTLETQVQLKMEVQWHPYLFMIFFATVFEYNLHRFITVVFHPSRLVSEKYRWVNNHLQLFYFIFLFAIVGFIAALILAKKEVVFVLLPFGAITLLYSIPMVYWRGKFMRLRDLPYMKIFSIAVVWSASTLFLPLAKSSVNHEFWHIFGIFIERCLFVFAITLPFDVRDLEEDSRSGIKTIPMLVGEEMTFLIANGCLALFIVLGTWHYLVSEMYFMIWVYMISGITTLFVVNKKKLRSLPNYHYGILDGTMLFQGVLVVIVSVLNTVN